MKSLILIGAGLWAVLIACGANWLALIPWRSATKQHWTEQARLYHPVRIAAVSNLWVLPAVLTLFCLLVWPDSTPHWAFLVVVTAIGAVAGTLPMDREVFPRIGWQELLRQAEVGLVVRFLQWFVFLTAVALMPTQFNLAVLIVSAVMVVACFLWNRTGWIWLGRKMGWIVPAPKRLQSIVQETSTRMNVPYEELGLLRLSQAQALAMPARRGLLFTERLLEVLSDEEIAAICAHELGHLTETRPQYYRRYVVWLIFLPWLLFNPMVHTLGMLGFFLLLFSTLFMSFVYRRVSRSLEVRADSVAHSHEPDPGTYGRALLRLHEDNLVPAVMAEGRSTHPHLYDRLLALGLTPEFPRPRPAAAMAWTGLVFSSALGLISALLIIRLIQH